MADSYERDVWVESERSQEWRLGKGGGEKEIEWHISICTICDDHGLNDNETRVTKGRKLSNN